LDAVAEIGETEGISTIAREWGKRLIRVQANVAGRDVSSFVSEAQDKIASSSRRGSSFGWLIEIWATLAEVHQARPV
jgi:cobalt-zinc-cadmium resistance protein CzcA